MAVTDTISCLILLGLTFLIWKYYSSLPTTRMTVMTYLLKDFLICIALGRFIHFVKAMAVTVFASSIATVIKEMSQPYTLLQINIADHQIKHKNWGTIHI